jgi:hypothetical protein
MFETQPCYIVVILTNKRTDEIRKMWETETNEKDICMIPMSKTGEKPATHWACFFQNDTLKLRKISNCVRRNKMAYGFSPDKDVVFFGFQSIRGLSNPLFIYQDIQDLLGGLKLCYS